MAELANMLKKAIQDAVKRAIDSTETAKRQIVNLQEMIQAVSGSVAAIDQMEKTLTDAVEALKEDAKKLQEFLQEDTR